MKNNIIIVGVLALIVGAAGGFFGGMTYQKSQPMQFAAGGEVRQFEARSGATAGNRMMVRSGPAGSGASSTMSGIVGEVISKDAKSMTVKSQDGTSKIVIFSDKTSVSKDETVTVADVKVGEQVAAFGTTNSDGSVTADNIRLNPPKVRMMEAK